MKKMVLLFVLAAISVGFLYAQDIITAGRYMELVSERYGSIRDYEASVFIRSGNSEMAGIASYLAPSFLRVDFSRPAEQVIVFNSELLTIYLPEFRATLNQTISRSRRAMNITSSQGLSMLRRNYIPAFLTGPSPEPLDGGSGENVIKLRLTRNSGAEGFRYIILSISPDTRLIRRIEGRTLAETDVRIDFTNIRINQGIPEQRFLYDPPPSANMYNNFLFRDVN